MIIYFLLESYYNRLKSLNNFIGACYQTEKIQKMLENFLGNSTLKDIQKKVLVLSFNLDADCSKPNNDHDPKNHR